MPRLLLEQAVSAHRRADACSSPTHCENDLSLLSAPESAASMGACVLQSITDLLTACPQCDMVDGPRLRPAAPVAVDGVTTFSAAAFYASVQGITCKVVCGIAAYLVVRFQWHVAHVWL